MLLVLFLIFTAIPIAEVAVFIEAGRLIGIVPTILITIGTAIAGSILMRIQGFAALNRFAKSVNDGEMPLTPVIDGVGILAAGLLLLTPGLITDTIGFLLFVPFVRRSLAKWLFRSALSKGAVHFRTFGFDSPSGPRPGSETRGEPNFRRSENVVDAEFETIDPDHKKDEEDGPVPLTDEKDRRSGSNGRKRNSPWRKP
jgi:UPF0716 protein FxsA